MRQLQAPDFVADLVSRNVQATGNFLRVCIQVAHLVAQQQRRERWIVINNNASFAVQYLAARSENGHAAHTVLLSSHQVFIALADLQAP